MESCNGHSIRIEDDFWISREGNNKPCFVPRSLRQESVASLLHGNDSGLRRKLKRLLLNLMPSGLKGR